MRSADSLYTLNLDRIHAAVWYDTKLHQSRGGKNKTKRQNDKTTETISRNDSKATTVYRTSRFGNSYAVPFTCMQYTIYEMLICCNV